MKTEIVIFGQGIAGTLLSFLLREADIPHVVFDKGHAHSASAVAAGIVNPITGRWFSLVSGYQHYVSAFDLYRRLEIQLNGSFLNPLPIYRDLTQPESRAQWEQRLMLDQEYEPYMELPLSGNQVKAKIELPSLLGPTLGGYRVDLKGLLSSFRQNLLSKGQILEAAISLDNCTREQGYWKLPGGVEARHIIDARGAGSIGESWWSMIPWVGTKGEALRLRGLDQPLGFAVKRKFFLAPFAGADELWLGGTSFNRDLDPNPTSAGIASLREQLLSFGLEPKDELEVLCAIRPTVRDYTPRAIAHPEQPGLWLLNALGTKGTLWAPRLAIDLLEQIRQQL